ncbi:Smg-4/UPF3 family-domain-containing protein [Gloeopeniophorella convolvens]|nr:Smg-4/UPF3 family-domain-containing protein [Gloeopeniophorella convolvens]
MSATTEIAKKPQTKSKPKEKRQGQPKASGTERLKTVVRRLPPNLPEPIFWQSVQAWVSDDTVLWKEFWPGKLRKKLNKENVHSRAYIAFKTEDLVAKFSREYDGHVFRDKTGNESQVVVEFAPYQKLPLEKKKADTRNATIEQDEEYIAFLQSLETSSTKPYDADQLLEMLVASTERPSMPTSTPLLEALKAEKSAQRDKEAIQRNHPHYKEAKQSSKKEEAKKAAAAAKEASTAKQSGDPAAPVGKRAAKKAAAAAQKASTQPGSSAPPKPGSGQAAATSSAKTPASPSKPKAGRANKQHAHALAQAQDGQPPKAAPVPPTQATATAPAASPAPSTETSTSTPAPPSASGGGRRARPVLGIASRQFEAALSGAGVAKGSRRERGADKDKDKDTNKELPKDGAPSAEKKEGGGGGRRKKDGGDAAARNATTTPQPGVLPALAILQREAKQPGARPAQHSAPADGASGTGAPSEAGPPARGSAKRGRGRGRGANRGGAPGGAPADP